VNLPEEKGFCKGGSAHLPGFEDYKSNRQVGLKLGEDTLPYTYLGGPPRGEEADLPVLCGYAQECSGVVWEVFAGSGEVDG
jgi:hypothetical protein